MKYRIYIEKESDRDDAAVILVRNGYTVRRGKEKSKTGNKFHHFVEYWKDGDC